MSIRRPGVRLAGAAAAAALSATGLAVAAPAAGTTVPRTFTVADSAQLHSAIGTARSGDRILLATGNYGTFRLFRRPVAGGGSLLIEAAPGASPVFARIDLEASPGYHFRGVTVTGSASPLVRIVTGSNNVRITDSLIHGLTANRDPWDDANTGMWIRSSSNVAVSNSRFHDLRTAVYVQNAFDVAITRSSFTFLREGLNIASLGRGDISGNLFHSFFPRYDLFEHPDAIQVWTRGETWGSHDIQFRNNFFNLGGPRAVQGIFIRSEEAEIYNKPVFLRNFTITGNIYYGSSLHGISLSSVHGARVANNIAVASPHADLNNSNVRSADGRTSGGLQPHIRAINAVDVVLDRNVSMNTPGGTGVTVTDHIALFNTHTRRGEAWTTVLAARPTADMPPLSAFVTVSPSVAATRGIGVLQAFPVGPF